MENFVTREEFLKFQREIQKNTGQENKLSIVVFSGTLDKMMAAFIIATGAAAAGMETQLFFTFWGTSALKKNNVKNLKKNFLEKAFGWMLPRGTSQLPLTHLNMAGLGPEMIRYMMKKKSVASVEELIKVAEELGVKINICDMSMDLMGIKPEEICDYSNLGYCGVAKFLEEASTGKITLFI
jgi:peroxiredoxin family protein